MRSLATAAVLTGCVLLLNTFLPTREVFYVARSIGRGVVSEAAVIIAVGAIAISLIATWAVWP